MTSSRGNGLVATMAANGVVALQPRHTPILTQTGLDGKFESSHSQEAQSTDSNENGAFDLYKKNGTTNLTNQSGTSQQQFFQALGDCQLSRGNGDGVFNAGIGLKSRRPSSVHEDRILDPFIFEKVAARNGMTAMRFANQPEDRIKKMIGHYVNEKDMVERSKTLLQETKTLRSGR